MAIGRGDREGRRRVVIRGDVVDSFPVLDEVFDRLQVSFFTCPSSSFLSDLVFFVLAQKKKKSDDDEKHKQKEKKKDDEDDDGQG